MITQSLQPKGYHTGAEDITVTVKNLGESVVVNVRLEHPSGTRHGKPLVIERLTPGQEAGFLAPRSDTHQHFVVVFEDSDGRSVTETIEWQNS